jgi:hypothetical protein
MYSLRQCRRAQEYVYIEVFCGHNHNVEPKYNVIMKYDILIKDGVTHMNARIHLIEWQDNERKWRRNGLYKIFGPICIFTGGKAAGD